MSHDRPNVLVILTDEERYPPAYEQAPLRDFRRDQLPARERLRAVGAEWHRHYVGSTACVPSRATLFTGQYPSRHGVTMTDGLAKTVDDPAMRHLDPDGVPTMGDWFRAAGYETHYRGKWHISHADLVLPGTHRALATNDDDGVVDDAAVSAYRGADRLDGFGFSGWIGPEPHGPARSNCGMVRDGIYATQVTALFDQLGRARRVAPWLAVASFVNPHDIVFSGAGWTDFLGFDPPGAQVPDIPEAPSQRDSFDGRPAAQAAYAPLWDQMAYEQPRDGAYRRLYHYLMQRVDEAIMAILDALERTGMADDTIILFTSDHGDMLGAHGGMAQKWYNAFDESVRVPLVVTGPDIATSGLGTGGSASAPTSHVDLLPTLLGLADIDVEGAEAELSKTHFQTGPLPGRDLSSALRGADPAVSGLGAPVYFMTEDDVSRGLRSRSLVSGRAYDPVPPPAKVEAVVAVQPDEEHGTRLCKITHYYDRLRDWELAHGIDRGQPGEGAPDEWELYDLSRDPEERDNLAADRPEDLAVMTGILDRERAEKRLVPGFPLP